MRRNDRAVTDPAEIEAFLAEEQILRIAFYDDGELYIVPVNYGYCLKNGTYHFYFHGAKAGRKYTLAQAAPKVGFELDGQYALISAENGCGHSARYKSVIGTGTLHIVADPDEQLYGLRSIMRQTTGRTDWCFDPAVTAKTAVFRLDAEQLSCKAKT